jgi:hypothetical protein
LKSLTTKMKKKTTSSYPEPIQFVKPTSVTTSGGGQKQTGEAIVRACDGLVSTKPMSRFTEDGNVRFKTVLTLEVWNDESIIIATDCLIKYRGNNFEIIDIDNVSDRFKTIYTATARK